MENIAESKPVEKRLSTGEQFVKNHNITYYGIAKAMGKNPWSRSNFYHKKIAGERGMEPKEWEQIKQAMIDLAGTSVGIDSIKVEPIKLVIR